MIEIDLTAFKQLILLNAGEEGFNQELYQVRNLSELHIHRKTFQFQKSDDGKKQTNKKNTGGSQFVKNDSEFLI